jgi:hypothetical protein
MLEPRPLLQPRSFMIVKKNTEKEYHTPKAMPKVINPIPITTHP